MAANLRARGLVGEAESAELRAIECGLAQPEVKGAENALRAGKLEDAEQLIRPYLRQHPQDVVATLILGAIAEQCGAVVEAENLFKRAVLLAPAYVEAKIALVKLYNSSERHDEALAILNQALVISATHPMALLLRAGLLAQQRRFEEAEAAYQILIDAHPGDSHAWVHFGDLLKTIGKFSEAIEAYRTAIDLDPTSGLPWWRLGDLKTLAFTSDDANRMRAALLQPSIDPDDEIYLRFALWKALDGDQQFAEGFEHLLRGNALRRTKAPYDAQAARASVLKNEDVFNRRFFDERSSWGSSDHSPIFIVGMPRSGSTLVEQILASHPLVEGTRELFDIEHLARGLSPELATGQYLDRLEGAAAGDLRKMGERYIESTRRHRLTDRPFFTDKMPSNWNFVGLIAAILPNAKIVDVRRHPMACGFANFTQHYSWGINFSYDLADIGRFYSAYVRQMAHFDRVLPGRVHHIMYENLVDNFEPEVRRLLDYLGLPFDEACLRFFENKRAVHTPSAEQVRRPINRSGMDRWRSYEPWLGPLKESLGPVLDLYPEAPTDWPD